jgi:TubC N-terminal docking domain
MTALALLRQRCALGVALTPLLEGTLRYRAPKDVLTSALLDGIRQHKQERYALVEAFEERAALMEYDGRLPRDEAECLAWACIQSAQTLGLSNFGLHADVSHCCGTPSVFSSSNTRSYPGRASKVFGSNTHCCSNSYARDRAVPSNPGNSVAFVTFIR